MTVIVRPAEGESWRAHGPADLSAVGEGDRVIFAPPSNDDAARWAPAVWFALVRGADVVVVRPPGKPT